MISGKKYCTFLYRTFIPSSFSSFHLSSPNSPLLFPLISPYFPSFSLCFPPQLSLFLPNFPQEIERGQECGAVDSSGSIKVQPLGCGKRELTSRAGVDLTKGEEVGENKGNVGEKSPPQFHFPRVWLDGPHGSPSEDFQNFRAIMLVGAGSVFSGDNWGIWRGIWGFERQREWGH